MLVVRCEKSVPFKPPVYLHISNKINIYAKPSSLKNFSEIGILFSLWNFFFQKLARKISETDILSGIILIFFIISETDGLKNIWECWFLLILINSFIKNNGLKFKEGHILNEKWLFHMKSLNRDRKMVYFDRNYTWTDYSGFETDRNNFKFCKTVLFNKVPYYNYYFLFPCRPNTGVFWSILRTFRSKRGHTRLLRVHLFLSVLFCT